MGFILDGLDTEAYDRKYTDRELVRRIVGYFKPYARKMGLVVAMLTLNSLTGTAAPILISQAIDLLQEDPATTNILLLTGGVLLLGISGWGFNFVRQFFSARVLGSVVLDLRRDVFRAIIRNDLSFYDEHPSGKIVSRVTSDTQDFSEVAGLVMELLNQVLLVVLLSSWLLYTNVWLTLLLLAFSPLAVLIALSFRRVARRVTQNARRVTAKINARIQEAFSGIMVAKSFRQEHSIYDRFAGDNRQAFHVGLRRGLTLNAIFPMVGIASGISIAALLFAGGQALRGGFLTLGSLYLFMQAVGYYWWPMLSISSFWSQFQDGLSAAERVFALIDARPRVIQTAAEPVGPVTGRITFERVRFAYKEDEPVLADFSLDIRPGETLALVGHTGAGKSSLARLITRFYEFQGGELRLDGRDVRRLDLFAYRGHIGIVPQEPFLFSGTLRDNIRYSRPDASDEEVRQAATHIGGGDWLADLSNGLDTDVGERGASLSVGQRQLAALARVLLKDPAILILDEATASVDPFTETQIQEGLETIMHDRTAIVIAHRLSTVKRADRIIVIEHGQIIEEGTHEQLLAAGGQYAELYNTYFRHQSLEYIESLAWEE